ncbi:MFS transporter [Halobacteriaceae archaeon GCM10025711]
MSDGQEVSALATFREFFALRRDVFVLSVAMFAFSLGFQMTSRYLPRYMSVLGAGAAAIGLYGSFGNLIAAVYPYPGGAFSDRVGSRTALTAFGLLSTLGFAVWLVAPAFGAVTVGTTLPLGPLAGVTVGPVTLPDAFAFGPTDLPVGVFLGLLLAQAWKSLGLGATFAVVKQSVPESDLATGFASTETFRRVAFLLGPLVAAGLFAATDAFLVGFRYVLGVALAFAAFATVAQRLLYDPEGDSLGKQFTGVSRFVADLRSLPPTLRPLLVGDTLVRFANGMVYVFFVIVVTEFLAVDLTVFGRYLGPDALFGVLLAVEMVVALLVMVPSAKAARRFGLKPVVAAGFLVYAVFPVLLISAPADPLVVGVLFAVSGLRFAGLPAHKALIVGPAEANAGGRVTGAYYLLRNVVTIPSAVVGGWLYAVSPTLAFTVATVVGLAGTAYFLAFGREFEAYR